MSKMTMLQTTVMRIVMMLLIVCLTVPILPATVANAATTITNPSFETGDLTGWTVVSGTAFTNASSASETDYWNLQSFNQSNFWHIWGGKGDNTKLGVMKSDTFTLGGSGQISLMIGGTNDLANTYVALVDNSNGAELLKATGTGSDTYSTVSWNASAYIGKVVYIKLVDTSTTGHLNLDNIIVPPTPTLNNHAEPGLYNHDFEYSDLNPGVVKGWTVVSGDAFGPNTLVHDKYYSLGGKFHQGGSRHLWGFKAGGDAPVGVLRSQTFTLSGNGGIDFLIGGGRDINNLYVALVKASDGSILFKETGRNSEAYQRVYWNASAYLGQNVYISIVDSSSGGFGHINADDFNVLNSKYYGGVVGSWSFNEGTGKTTTDAISGAADPIAYHLNTGVFQPSQDPLWRTDGINSKALLFDGYSTVVTHTADQIPVPQTAITVEAWVAPRNFEHGDEGRLSAIVNQHNREAKEGYILGNFRHGTWGFQFGTGTDWREVTTGTLLPLDEWTYITATYDSVTGKVVLYQNGQQVASANFPAGQKIQPSATDMLIGQNNQGMWLYGYTMNMFSGELDEVKIRDTALSASTVLSNYNAYVSALGGNLPTANNRIDRSVLANDSQRPQFHAEPTDHWQNEPGGPIYFNGQYHTFYQSNPRGPFWNHIRWGHMVSTDMIHWRDAKDAVIPGHYDVDPDGAWAGGAVVDDTNNPVIFYTAGDDRRSPGQRINIARSNYAADGDNDLNKWNKNASVILNQGAGEGMPGEFRDPFVFKDASTGTWFMLVTSGIAGQGGTALVYSTTDASFQSWTYRGPLFTGDATAFPLTGKVWELPNLRPLGTSGKYIFMINPAQMANPEFQSRYTWYWIGTWNPTTARFTPDNTTPQLLDVGETFTGPASFVTPDGRTVVQTIAQGRRPATMDYQAGYAHNYGLPVSVFLRGDGRLGIDPIVETQSLRGTQLVNITTDTTFAAANAILAGVSGDMLEINLELSRGLANEAGISVLRSPGAEEETVIYYKNSSKEYFVNRTKSSLNPDVEKWYQGGVADIGTENTKLHLFIDRSMVESYLNSLKGLTTRAYPTRSDAKGLQLFANSDSNTVVVKSLQIWQMNSAYPTVNPTGVNVSPATKQIMVGASADLTPIVAPATATNKDVIWTSSNTAVATVVNGKVSAKAVGTATITARTRIGSLAGTSAITVVAPPASVGLINKDFDQNLSGWTILSGNAFSTQDVTDANDWGWGGPFNQHGSYHLAGGKDGGDAQVGSIRSHMFTLGGNGQIDFLVGGGNNIYDEYVALVRASDGKELMKATGSDQEGYTRVKWDASAYIGTKAYIKVVDNSTGAWGHINLDDVNVPVQPPAVTNISNPDFETGTLAGWTIVSGTAFSNGNVANDTTYWTPPKLFGQNGTYHMWGFKGAGDTPVGVMKSTTFTLAGTGWVDFLIGGGKDLNNLYVSLVRASDGAELFKATGYDDEAYHRVYWDASAYVGEDVYLKVVDNSTGGFGHVNVDDIHVYNTESDISTGDRYQKYRDQYHFTPDRKWMNDPNGLVYYAGEYHMFYQHNPTSTTWGPMSWGHAVSTDLKNWTRLPIAIEPDAAGFIWSGSVVVDTNNTSGFQTGAEKPMVAIFTQENGGTQVQSLAYSNDKGRTWTKYASNPVLTASGLSVFRDPKVFWHAATSKWVMVISGGDRVKIYTSTNLKAWTFASDFGVADGSHAGTWECPDLVQLSVDGSATNKKWVLMVSIANGAPAGGSGMQYFVGQFNGTTFTNDNASSTTLWAENGSDYYAAVTFGNMPAGDGRTISLGWMNNWNYGQSIPTSVWRSTMSVPRELKLATVGGNVRLTQLPVTETAGLRGTGTSWTNQTITPGSNLLSAKSGSQLEIVADFQVNTATATEFGFKVRKGGDQFTTIGYDKTNSKLFVDRTSSGESGFNSTFAARHEVVMSPDSSNKVKLRILVDRSTVEAFGNDGAAAISDQIFPNLSSVGLELYSVGGNVTLNSLTLYPVNNATFN